MMAWTDQFRVPKTYTKVPMIEVWVRCRVACCNTPATSAASETERTMGSIWVIMPVILVKLTHADETLPVLWHNPIWVAKAL